MVTLWRPFVRHRGLWMPGIWWVLCSLHARDCKSFYAALSLFCDGFEHFEDITIRVQVRIICCDILQRSRARHIASSHNRHDTHATHTHFICNHVHPYHIHLHACYADGVWSIIHLPCAHRNTLSFSPCWGDAAIISTLLRSELVLFSLRL